MSRSYVSVSAHCVIMHLLFGSNTIWVPKPNALCSQWLVSNLMWFPFVEKLITLRGSLVHSMAWSWHQALRHLLLRLWREAKLFWTGHLIPVGSRSPRGMLHSLVWWSYNFLKPISYFLKSRRVLFFLLRLEIVLEVLWEHLPDFQYRLFFVFEVRLVIVLLDHFLQIVYVLGVDHHISKFLPRLQTIFLFTFFELLLVAELDVQALRLHPVGSVDLSDLLLVFFVAYILLHEPIHLFPFLYSFFVIQANSWGRLALSLWGQILE